MFSNKSCTKKTITPIVDLNKPDIAEKQILNRSTICGPSVATYEKIDQ